MLPSTSEEKDGIRGYFEWQAPDLDISFIQKMYSESILGHQHVIWDVHASGERWWVITNPTNLYSQEQFPNMDLALTFHVGIYIRLPKDDENSANVERIQPFNVLLMEIPNVHEALKQAINLRDYQSIGTRCRELLLSFTSAAQDAAEWPTEQALKNGSFKEWMEIICGATMNGPSQRQRRRLLRTLLNESWDYSSWLVHTKSATWHDAEACVSAVEVSLGLIVSKTIQALRGVPEECPNCNSPHLSPEEGYNPEEPEVIWERPCCLECDWKGIAVPIEVDGQHVPVIVREGEMDDEACGSPAIPVTELKKPQA